MLGMVRTNTRDDGPGVSHTSVEEYYDADRLQREVALLFRHYPIVVAFSVLDRVHAAIDHQFGAGDEA